MLKADDRMKMLHQASEALRHLGDIPEGFVERIEKIVFPAGPVTLETLLDQQKELEQLLAEVEGIVAGNRAGAGGAL